MKINRSHDQMLPGASVRHWLLVAVLLGSSGCTMMEWMKPHQLRKLNRQPAPRSEEDYFSIPDPPRPDRSGKSTGTADSVSEKTS